MKYPQLPSFLLRIGLSVMFLYAAIDGFINPENWIGYLPHIATTIIPAAKLLTVYKIYELVLAALLLSGRKILWVASLTALTFIGIIVSNLNTEFAIIFRDIGLFMSACALIALHIEKK